MRKPVSSTGLDRSGLHRLANAGDTPLEALRAAGAETRHGARRQLDAKQVGHQCDQPILGDKLIRQQIHHHGHETGTVLHWRRHTPSGNSAWVDALHWAHWQLWARCSVTSKGGGGGRSNTWRAW